MVDAQFETSVASGQQAVRGAPDATRALTPETARLYASGWAAFVTWCRSARANPLPAEPQTVADYLATLGHLSPGAAARRLAAISDQHRRAGLPVSTTAPGVRSALRQARRTAPPRRKPLPAPAPLLRMAASCPRDFAGLRDRALLLLMAEASLSRSTLTGLQAEHVRFTAPGVELRTEDAEGASRLVMTAPRKPDHATCPARALEDWLRTSDTAFGPVFRKALVGFRGGEARTGQLGCEHLVRERERA